MGPPLGGLLVGHLSWRWIFLVNVPIGLYAQWQLRSRVPVDRRDAAPARLHVPGAVLPLLDQPKLVEDFLHPYAEEIRGARDTFERTVYLWCVETLVPLRQSRPGELHVVFFENLVRNPEAEIARLFSHLGKSMDGLDLERLKTPSLTARRASSAVWTGADPVDSWKKKVSDEQRKRALEILERFGLDCIYTDQPMPRMEGVMEIMGGNGRT